MASNNFFTLFGIPFSYHIDAEQLEQRYTTLIQQTHPDNIQQLSELEQQVSTQKNALIHRAYSVLMEPITRAEHIAEILKVDTEQSLSTSFLMQQLELEELIQENDNATKEKAHRQLTEELQQLCDQFDRQISLENFKNLGDTLNQMRFLNSFINRLHNAPNN